MTSQPRTGIQFPSSDEEAKPTAERVQSRAGAGDPGRPAGTAPEQYITLYEFARIHQRDYSFATLGGFIATQEALGNLSGLDSALTSLLTTFATQTIATRRPKPGHSYF